MSCKCHTTSGTPVCKAGCIIGGHHVVYSQDSVGNYGQVGTVDLMSIPVNTRNNTVCGTQVFFRYEKHDTDGIEWATIHDNILRWQFKTTTKLTDCFRIRGSVVCPTTGHGEFFDILVCVKDLCATTNCSNGFECNPETGLCIVADIDVTT